MVKVSTRDTMRNLRGWYVAFAAQPFSTIAMSHSGQAAGTGSAVTDLIFSIAKREVTFFSGTALISFL